MDQRPIVVGWDGSEHAQDALELGRVLAHATGASLVAAEVAVDRLGARRKGPDDTSGGVVMEERALVSSSPAHGLHDVADEAGAELIVIGSTHRAPAGRVFLGSVADDLIHGAPCAVAIAPQRYARRYGQRLIRVVVAAFDTSPETRAAVERAGRIAQRARASLRLLSGDAAPTLLDETAEGVDLLVVGSPGWGPAGHRFLAAACPVMVVPSGHARSGVTTGSES